MRALETQELSDCMSGRFALVAVLVMLAAPAVRAEREDEAHVAHAKEYFINIGRMAEEDLVRKVKSIPNDAPVELATKILGTPDTDRKLVDKRGTFVVRRLSYYSKKAAKNLVNEKEDRYLALDFDTKGRLIAKWEKLGANRRRPL